MFLILHVRHSLYIPMAVSVMVENNIATNILKNSIVKLFWDLLCSTSAVTVCHLKAEFLFKNNFDGKEAKS